MQMSKEQAEATNKMNACAKFFLQRRVETAIDRQIVGELERAIAFARDFNLPAPSIIDDAVREMQAIEANCIKDLTLATSNFKRLYAPDSDMRRQAEANLP